MFVTVFGRSGDIFIIKNATKYDRGLYDCVASNGNGDPAKMTTSLDIKFPPIISVPRPKVAQAIYYDTEMQCLVEAWPAPAIQWFKDSIELHTDSDYRFGTMDMRILDTKLGFF